jgi:hypothetical protein
LQSATSYHQHRQQEAGGARKPKGDSRLSSRAAGDAFEGCFHAAGRVDRDGKQTLLEDVLEP